MDRQTTSSSQTHLRARCQVGPGRRLLEDPQGGIVLEVARLDFGDGSAALALVADLAGVDGGRNTGASATNSLDLIVRTYQDVILETLGVSEVLWTELDSMGNFDRVITEFCSGGVLVDWQPLLSGWHEGRTGKDFVALFGQVGQQLLDGVHASTALT